MPAILTVLNLAIQAFSGGLEAYNAIRQVWEENHVAGDPAWEDFKSRFDAAGARLHDPSRDV